MKKIDFSIFGKILEIGEKKISFNLSIPFKPLWKVLFFITIYWIVEIISYNKYTGSSIYSGLLVFVLCILIVLYPKRGAYISIPIMIFADDISKFNPLMLGGTTDLHSIWTFKIIGMTFPYFFILSVLISIYIRVILSNSVYKITKIDKAMFFLLVTYLIGLFSGLYQKASSVPKYAISDFAPVVVIFAIYFYIRFFFQNKKTLSKIIEIIYISIGVKAFMGVIFFLSGYGTQFGTTIRVSLESGRVFYIFSFFYALLSILYRHRKKDMLLHLLIGISSIFLVITYSGRMEWIFTFIGIIIIYFSTQKAIRTKVVSLSFSLIAAIIFLLFLSGKTQTIFHRFSTLKRFTISSVGGETSTGTRIVEIINIWQKLRYENKMLFGAGMGNWFTDKYFRFPWPLGPADYRWEWRQAGTYFNPHPLLVNIFFKSGFSGLIIYFIFLYLVFSLINRLKKQRMPLNIKITLVSIYAYIPYLLLNHWSSKIRILLGLLLGIIANIEILLKEDFSPE